jgi:hypothetical protein
LIKLNYISHGRQVTGGYLHEKNLAEKLSKALAIELHELRQWQYFENLQAHIKLLHWAFKMSDADLNICVSRLALPSILKNIFSNRKTLVVWHYFDEKDKKSKFLKTYYQILIRISLFIPSKKLAFIAVAPYWKSYFEKEFKLKKVFYFPNLFQPNLYEKFIGSSKKKQIHLGQVSFKNSAELFYLAEQLFVRGYFCYFSTNDPKKVYESAYYKVIYFNNHDEYLQHMAESEYTLAMPAIEEGWNRIAHESLLVGTQVIGFNKGGLGDLLRGSNAFMIGSKPINNQIEHFKTREFGNNTMPPPTVVNAMYLILNQIQAPINRPFLDQFNDNKAPEFIAPICDWYST